MHKRRVIELILLLSFLGPIAEAANSKKACSNWVSTSEEPTHQADTLKTPILILQDKNSPTAEDINRLIARFEKAKLYAGDSFQFEMLEAALQSPTLHHPEGISACSNALMTGLISAIENIPYAHYQLLFETRTLQETQTIPQADIENASNAASEMVKNLNNLNMTLESAMHLLSTAQAAFILHSQDSSWNKIRDNFEAALKRKLNERLTPEQATEFQLDIIAGRKDTRSSFMRRIVANDLDRVEQLLQAEFRPGSYFDLVAAAELECMQPFGDEIRSAIKGIKAIESIKSDISAIRSSLQRKEPDLGFSLIHWPIILLKVRVELNGRNQLRAAFSKLFESVQLLRETQALASENPTSIEGLLDLIVRLRESKEPDPGGIVDTFNKAREKAEKTYLKSLFAAVSSNNINEARELLSVGAYSRGDLKNLRDPQDGRRTLKSLGRWWPEMTELLGDYGAI